MRRILVGIDGSQSSVHAARFAGELGLSWSFLECIGDPAQQLEALADKEQADLVVVGAHGLGSAEHLGTTRLGGLRPGWPTRATCRS